MPPLSNPRQETFAQVAAAGNSFTKAYEAAGYAPNRHNASRLVNTNEHVAERIIELQQYGCDLAQITVASLVSRAEEVRQKAVEFKQLSAAVGAIKEMGILTGLRIDRREVGSPGEFERLSDDELKHFIASENAKLIDIPAE